MSKFKIGDKVRASRCGTVHDIINNEVALIDVDDGYRTSAMLRDLELASEPTRDELLARIKHLEAQRDEAVRQSNLDLRAARMAKRINDAVAERLRAAGGLSASQVNGLAEMVGVPRETPATHQAIADRLRYIAGRSKALGDVAVALQMPPTAEVYDIIGQAKFYQNRMDGMPAVVKTFDEVRQAAAEVATAAEATSHASERLKQALDGKR